MSVIQIITFLCKIDCLYLLLFCFHPTHSNSVLNVFISLSSSTKINYIHQQIVQPNTKTQIFVLQSSTNVSVLLHFHSCTKKQTNLFSNSKRSQFFKNLQNKHDYSCSFLLFYSCLYEQATTPNLCSKLLIFCTSHQFSRRKNLLPSTRLICKFHNKHQYPQLCSPSLLSHFADCLYSKLECHCSAGRSHLCL